MAHRFKFFGVVYCQAGTLVNIECHRVPHAHSDETYEPQQHSEMI